MAETLNSRLFHQYQEFKFYAHVALTRVVMGVIKLTSHLGSHDMVTSKLCQGH